MGHTCGVRVDGAAPRGLCKRVASLPLRGQGERFLGLTGPMGRRVLKFDGAFGPEGCGLPFGQYL